MDNTLSKNNQAMHKANLNSMFILLFTIVLSSISSGNIYARSAKDSIVLSINGNNTLFYGEENTVHINIKEIPFEEVSFTCEGAEIQKKPIEKEEKNSSINRGMTILVTPFSIGELSINIIHNNEIVETIQFIVKVRPPIAKIGHYSGGSISQDYLMAAKTIYISYNQTKCAIISFSVSATGIDNTEIKEISYSREITMKQKRIIENLEREQKVYFTDIKCSGPDGKVFYADPIVFKIR